MKNVALKKRIFEIIEVSRENDMASRSYDIMINTAIIVGLIPLMMKKGDQFTAIIDVLTLVIFIVDYLLRIYTSDYKMGIVSYKAYLANLLDPMSVIDFFSILPVFSFFFPASITIRLFKLFRVFRIFKLARYSKTMITIKNVMIRVKAPLGAVLILSIVYIVICALLMFQVEPDSFNTFLDACYWSTISLTTVGYGDYTPETDIGKAISSLSALVGVAVIALPSGIITAAYMREITKVKGKNEL